MKKIFYYICRVLNWVLPCVLIWYSMWSAQYKSVDGLLVNNHKEYVMGVVVSTYILFWLVRLWEFRSGANRICHEAVVFIGMIGTVILAVRNPTIITLGNVEYKRQTVWIVGIIVFAVLILLSRAVTFFSESEKYASKSEARYRKSLDYDVKKRQEYVADRVKQGDYANAKKGEMDLEEAKHRRDRYYDSKKDDSIF